MNLLTVVWLSAAAVRLGWKLVFELTVVDDSASSASDHVPVRFHVPLSVLPPARMIELPGVGSATAGVGEAKVASYPVARLSHGRTWHLSTLKRTMKLL
jgi:hypothetical protein